MSDLQKAVAAIIIISELLSDYEDEEEELQVKKKRKKEVTRSTKKEKIQNVNLTKELRRDPEPTDYLNYLSLDEKIFGKLLNLIKHKITKEDTLMRLAIPPEVRLAITLKYLQTGICFADLKELTAVSAQSIGKVVLETCDAINDELKHYVKSPTTSAEWIAEVEKFYVESRFPHCLGALGGKHIKIKRPPHSGGEYFNYNKTFSIILMAIANANSEFLMVDVDASGKISDNCVFSNTKFFRNMEKRKLNLPHPLLGKTLIPYVFVSDDAFPLHPNIMRPYAHSNLSYSETLFNKRLGTAREKVENAFKILSARFRVLNTTIALLPEKARKIVLSCCYLHNFIEKQMDLNNRGHSLITEVSDENSLLSLQPNFAMDSQTEAITARNAICEALFNWETKFS